MNLEDDSVHPYDRNEEKEEDGEHSILKTDDRALSTDGEEREADDEGYNERCEKFRVGERGVSVVIARDSLSEEETLLEDRRSLSRSRATLPRRG